MMDFPTRLRTLRERAGLSQGQLAREAGLSEWTVMRLEQGRNQPRWMTLRLLARRLGVTFAYLRSGRD